MQLYTALSKMRHLHIFRRCAGRVSILRFLSQTAKDSSISTLLSADFRRFSIIFITFRQCFPSSRNLAGIHNSGPDRCALVLYRCIQYTICSCAGVYFEVSRYTHCRCDSCAKRSARPEFPSGMPESPLLLAAQKGSRFCHIHYLFDTFRHILRGSPIHHPQTAYSANLCTTTDV